jgi:hypothetical protein
MQTVLASDIPDSRATSEGYEVNDRIRSQRRASHTIAERSFNVFSLFGYESVSACAVTLKVISYLSIYSTAGMNL